MTQPDPSALPGDVPLDVLEDTQARFIQRDQAREEHLQRLNVGGPLAAESPERVQARLTRLGVPAPEARAVAEGAVPVGRLAQRLPEEVAKAAERVLGANDLVNVTYLDAARSASRAVGRVVLRDARGRTQGFGTGWLCSPRVLLTNNHVLDSAAARTALVEFDYELRPDGTLMDRVTFELDPESLFLTSEPLDYSFVAVRGDASFFGWIPLYGSADKNVLGEALSIVQHPSGEPKQIALRENRLVDRLPDFLHYETDTAPGSSGSPVFNDAWEVVALHHSGVPRTDAQGRVLRRDGQPYTPGDPADQIDWLANEGVRVSRLLEDLAARSDAQGHPLVAEILSPARPPLIGAPQFSPATPAQAAAPRPAGPQDQIGRSPDSPSGEASQGQAPAVLDLGTLTPGPGGVLSLPVTLRLRLGGSAPAPSPAPEPAPAPSPATPAPAQPQPADAQPVDSQPANPTPRPAVPPTGRPYLDPADPERARAYYAGVARLFGEAPGSQTGEERFAALSELLRTTHHTQLSYQPSREVYPWVDLWPDGRLRSVYSGRERTPDELIAADEAAQARRERLAAQEGLLPESLEAAFPYNCEHVVPQSWFGAREPMRGDLHHLFACEPVCNSFRGNTPYFDFPDYGESVRSDCGRREPGEFEPQRGKGAVARATLYFLLRYPGTVRQYGERHLQTLLAWHAAQPPGEWEAHRNAAIFARQGNRNPLIDHPEWAAQVAFGEGLGR